MNSANEIQTPEDLRQQIRDEYRARAMAWLRVKRQQDATRIEYLEREMKRLRLGWHEKFMMALAGNPSVVTPGMSPSEAARVCCRMADALVQARRIEDGNDESG